MGLWGALAYHTYWYESLKLVFDIKHHLKIIKFSFIHLKLWSRSPPSRCFINYYPLRLNTLNNNNFLLNSDKLSYGALLACAFFSLRMNMIFESRMMLSLQAHSSCGINCVTFDYRDT